ncbi:hypothetical protein PoB_002036000 [Plakobranchus ocellatus]|uniref:Uncharacterized protein n=1 Tax=Plakobranchus ocellatus TaxID=259542 RepID=A0AAV3ZFD9_9GAST|nr:hypothetical protein PoB_002036000 [Plakobranchus ocellatus]
MQSLQSRQNHMCNNSDFLLQYRILISMTVHSVVAFDVDPEGQFHQHSTDDTAHDHRVVNTLTRSAISFLQSLLPAMGSHWQQSVPRALRTKTNFQTNRSELFICNQTSEQ